MDSRTVLLRPADRPIPTNKQLAIATSDATLRAGTGGVGEAGLGGAEEQKEEGGRDEAGEHGEILFARSGELCRKDDPSGMN